MSRVFGGLPPIQHTDSRSANCVFKVPPASCRVPPSELRAQMHRHPCVASCGLRENLAHAVRGIAGGVVEEGVEFAALSVCRRFHASTSVRNASSSGHDPALLGPFGLPQRGMSSSSAVCEERATLGTRIKNIINPNGVATNQNATSKESEFGRIHWRRPP
jgi:hypothetical protein